MKLDPSPSKSTILIVEDDKSIRETLATLLDIEGFTVITAVNGQAALDYLQAPARPRPQLIFLDLMMPVMDGWEFLKQKQQDRVLAPIPVVVLSAVKQPRHWPATVEYLHKPIELSALVELAERYTA